MRGEAILRCSSLVSRVGTALSAVVIVTLLIAARQDIARAVEFGVIGIVATVAWVVVAATIVVALCWRLAAALVRPVSRFAETLGEGGAAAMLTDRLEPAEIIELRRVIARRERRIEDAVLARSLSVATVIHDLKTPLVAVAQGLREIKKTLADKELRELARHMCDEVNRLLVLVDDMRTIEHDQSGVDLDRQRVNLVELCRVVCDRAASLRPDVTVKVAGPASIPAVVDRALIERSVENVVVNAVRYATAAVRVEVLRNLIRVSDDGAGMTPGVEHEADSAHQPWRRRGGGLGLFIARWALDAHGGKLVVESSGPAGTVVLLYLGSDVAPSLLTGAERV